MKAFLAYACFYLLFVSCHSGNPTDSQSDLSQNQLVDEIFSKHLNFSRALHELVNIRPLFIDAFEIERQEPETFQEKMSLLLDETKFKLQIWHAFATSKKCIERSSNITCNRCKS